MLPNFVEVSCLFTFISWLYFEIGPNRYTATLAFLPLWVWEVLLLLLHIYLIHETCSDKFLHGFECMTES